MPTPEMKEGSGIVIAGAPIITTVDINAPSLKESPDEARTLVSNASVQRVTLDPFGWEALQQQAQEFMQQKLQEASEAAANIQKQGQEIAQAKLDEAKEAVDAAQKQAQEYAQMKLQEAKEAVEDVQKQAQLRLENTQKSKQLLADGGAAAEAQLSAKNAAVSAVAFDVDLVEEVEALGNCYADASALYASGPEADKFSERAKLFKEILGMIDDDYPEVEEMKDVEAEAASVVWTNEQARAAFENVQAAGTDFAQAKLQEVQEAAAIAHQATKEFVQEKAEIAQKQAQDLAQAKLQEAKEVAASAQQQAQDIAQAKLQEAKEAAGAAQEQAGAIAQAKIQEAKDLAAAKLQEAGEAAGAARDVAQAKLGEAADNMQVQAQEYAQSKMQVAQDAAEAAQKQAQELAEAKMKEAKEAVANVQSQIQGTAAAKLREISLAIADESPDGGRSRSRTEEEINDKAKADAEVVAKLANELSETATRLGEADVTVEKVKVNEWCKKNGYKDVTSMKKTFRRGTKFPLHTAVKQNDAEMLLLLLKSGADKGALDSSKCTAAQLAAKSNKNGSHAAVLNLLS